MRWPHRPDQRWCSLLRDARCAARQLHTRAVGLVGRRLAGRHLDRPWLDRREVHPGQRVQRHCQLLHRTAAAAAAAAATTAASAPTPALAALAAALAAATTSIAGAYLGGQRDHRQMEQRGHLGADVRWPLRPHRRRLALLRDARSAAGQLHSRFDGLLRRRLAGRHLDSPWLDRPELHPGQRVERHCQLLCGPTAAAAADAAALAAHAIAAVWL